MNAQDTKRMDRFPDSPPRISRRLRFPIFLLIGVDIGLAGLILVVAFTQLHPVYNDNQLPTWTPQPQRVASVVLPAPVRTTASTAPRASVAPPQPSRVSHPSPSPQKPSQRPPVASTSAAPATYSPPPPPRPTTPNPTESGSPVS